VNRIILVFLGLCLSCAPEQTATQIYKPRVKVVVLATQELAREIESFGSISFLVKADLSNLVEGTVDQILAKEGAVVRRGQPLVRLKNPQLDMRKTQAEAALGIARSAFSVSQAQLWEGQLQVQARLIALDKAKLELDEKKLEWDEAERTYKNKQQLFDAGGTTQETLNGLKLNLAGLESSYQGLQKDWETKRIGLRDEVLVSYGMTVPFDPAEKLKSLVKLNTLTLVADLDSAKSKVDAAGTDVQSAQSLVDELTVLASMDGILGAKYVEAGDHVQPGTKLVTLIDTSAVYAVFPLQEDDAVDVSEGLAAEITLDAFPGRRFSGRVDLVSPLIDSQSGSVSVKARLNNPGARFKPGMFARVKVRLGSPAPTVMLPESAVVQKKGTKARIYAVVNGRVLGKDVELGKNQGGRYAVLSGAQEQDLVVDSPSPLLKEGEEVDAR
jgi:RND family efflux transporter MFP subunit